MKTTNNIKNLGLSCVLAISAGAAISASAALTSLDPLVNGDFEDSNVSAGENDELSGWARNPATRTVEIDDGTGGINNGSWNNTQGAASQVGMAFVNTSGITGSWFYQTLVGTSDTNGTSHTLTAGEAAGDTFTIAARIGIQSFSNGWADTHQLIRLGLQNQGTWDWQDYQDIYTGTLAQATTAGVTADLYLGLDDTNANGDSALWTYNATVPDSPATPGSDLAFSMNLTRVGGQGRGVFDDMSVTLVPEPSSASLLAALCGLGLIVRRRR